MGVPLKKKWKQIDLLGHKVSGSSFLWYWVPGTGPGKFAKLILPDQARPKQIIKKSYDEVSNYLK